VGEVRAVGTVDVRPLTVHDPGSGALPRLASVCPPVRSAFFPHEKHRRGRRRKKSLSLETLSLADSVSLSLSRTARVAPVVPLAGRVGPLRLSAFPSGAV
jgi:hypothetical protein